MYASTNFHKKKLLSLNIKVNTESKQKLTKKHVYLNPTIRDMILPKYSLSVFMVLLYVEAKITSIDIIDQNKSARIPRVSYSSRRCGHTSLTQKPRR